MRPEDLEKIKKLIETSNILSQIEKAEWSQLLPQMNDKQVLELMKILTPVSHPAQPQGTQAVKKPWELTIDTKEKELPTSQPQFEPELPSPHSVPNPAPAKDFSPAPRSPEDLQKLVEKMAGHKAVQPAPVPVKPKPEPAPKYEPAPDLPKPEPKKEEPEPEEDVILNTAEDFAKISPRVLHGKDPIPVLQNLLNALAAFVQRSHSFAAITNFQKSPLYQSYVNVGLALLNDPSEDRAVAFENVLHSLKSGGKDYLTKQEFEIFADFRKQIDKLFL